MPSHPTNSSSQSFPNNIQLQSGESQSRSDDSSFDMMRNVGKEDWDRKEELPIVSNQNIPERGSDRGRLGVGCREGGEWEGSREGGVRGEMITKRGQEYYHYDTINQPPTNIYSLSLNPLQLPIKSPTPHPSSRSQYHSPPSVSSHQLIKNPTSQITHPPLSYHHQYISQEFIERINNNNNDGSSFGQNGDSRGIQRRLNSGSRRWVGEGEGSGDGANRGEISSRKIGRNSSNSNTLYSRLSNRHRQQPFNSPINSPMHSPTTPFPAQATNITLSPRSPIHDHYYLPTNHPQSQQHSEPNNNISQHERYLRQQEGRLRLEEERWERRRWEVEEGERLGEIKSFRHLTTIPYYQTHLQYTPQVLLIPRQKVTQHQYTIENLIDYVPQIQEHVQGVELVPQQVIRHRLQYQLVEHRIVHLPRKWLGESGVGRVQGVEGIKRRRGNWLMGRGGERGNVAAMGEYRSNSRNNNNKSRDSRHYRNDGQQYQYNNNNINNNNTPYITRRHSLNPNLTIINDPTNTRELTSFACLIPPTSSALPPSSSPRHPSPSPHHRDYPSPQYTSTITTPPITRRPHTNNRKGLHVSSRSKSRDNDNNNSNNNKSRSFKRGISVGEGKKRYKQTFHVTSARGQEAHVEWKDQGNNDGENIKENKKEGQGGPGIVR